MILRFNLNGNTNIKLAAAVEKICGPSEFFILMHGL
jgi:hypothetical protein